MMMPCPVLLMMLMIKQVKMTEMKPYTLNGRIKKHELIGIRLDFASLISCVWIARICAIQTQVRKNPHLEDQIPGAAYQALGNDLQPRSVQFRAQSLGHETPSRGWGVIRGTVCQQLSWTPFY